MKIYTYAQHTNLAGQIYRGPDPEEKGEDLVEHDGTPEEIAGWMADSIEAAAADWQHDHSYDLRTAENVLAELPDLDLRNVNGAYTVFAAALRRAGDNVPASYVQKQNFTDAQWSVMSWLDVAMENADEPAMLAELVAAFGNQE